MTPVTSFDGEFGFLSNFYPVEVELDLQTYPSVEHAYQAAKTLRPDQRMPFQSFTLSAGDAKKFASRTKWGFELRPDWDKVKIGIMTMLCAQKFMLHPELGMKLVATRGRDLIGGNWWGDKFWGVCRGEGMNHLGEILMEIRATLLGQWNKIYDGKLL